MGGEKYLDRLDINFVCVDGFAFSVVFLLYFGGGNCEIG